MTFTFKHTVIDNVSIHIDQEKFENSFHVRAARVLSDGVCGYYITDLTYPTEKKATARFNYLVRKAKKGEL